MSEQAVMWGGTFPWPQAQKDQPVLSTVGAMVEVMNWRGLTLPERCVAMYVADGYGGPDDDLVKFAEAVEVTEADLLDVLWSLLRKGLLGHIAGRWS